MAATVKPLRYIPNGKRAVRASKNHIKYITAPREHHRNNPHLFDETRDYVNRREFFNELERQKPSPRHAFMHKLVISFSEEERDRLQIDMMELTRDAIARFKVLLNRELDWVAAIHDDKGHPHVHVVYRGRDKNGKPVFVGKEHLKELRKIVEEEKIRQAERTLGVEKAQEIIKEIKVLEIQKKLAKEKDKNPTKEAGNNLVQGLTGLTDAFAQVLREAEWEREQARREAERRKRKKEKKKQNRGR